MSVGARALVSGLLCSLLAVAFVPVVSGALATPLDGSQAPTEAAGPVAAVGTDPLLGPREPLGPDGTSRPVAAFAVLTMAERVVEHIRKFAPPPPDPEQDPETWVQDILAQLQAPPVPVESTVVPHQEDGEEDEEDGARPVVHVQRHPWARQSQAGGATSAEPTPVAPRSLHAPDGPGPATATWSSVGGASFMTAAVAAAGAAAGLLWLGLPKLRRVVPLAFTLFSRFDKDDILDHPTRARLLELVKENPGMNLAALRQATGSGKSQAEHHLTLLERHRLVVSKRMGRARHFYANGGAPAGRKEAYAVLRNERTRQIAAFIEGHPGALQRDIKEAFGVTSSVVHWHVQRLQDAGLVETLRRGRTVRHYDTKRLGAMKADGLVPTVDRHALQQGA